MLPTQQKKKCKYVNKSHKFFYFCIVFNRSMLHGLLQQEDKHF